MGIGRAAGWDCDLIELLDGPLEPFVMDVLCTLRLKSGCAELSDGEDGFVLGV